MKYKIAGIQEPLNHNETPLDRLRNLEIRAKVVKCRKLCYCSVCGRTIDSGELALKTIQRTDNHRNGFYYNVYCEEHYITIEPDCPMLPLTKQP